MDQTHPYDDDQKQREEHAYELAEYIHKHPTYFTLHERVALWTNKRPGDPSIEPLVTEIEKWLEQFDWQDEANS